MRRHHFGSFLIAPLLIVGLLSSSAIAAKGNKIQTPKVTSIRECMTRTGRLTVLFLIDESKSLQTSDPENQRVIALKAAAAALTLNVAWTTADGKPYRIEVLFAGFGSVYKDNSEWITLKDGEQRDVIDAIEAFRDKNTQSSTNYLKALEGAEQTFVKKAKDEGDKICKVLVWVSDGALDVDNNSKNTEPEEKAETEICKSDGVADRLRSQEVFTVGFGLSSVDPAKAPDFDLMSGIAIGVDCGSKPGNGKFTAVDIPNELIQSLFGDLGPGVVTSPVQPCADDQSNDQCAEVTFTASKPLDRAKILVSSSKGIESAEIIEPNAEQTPIVADGRAVVAAGEVVASRPLYDFASIVSINFVTQKSYGLWKIRFHGPEAKNAIVAMVFFSDVLAEIAGSDPIDIDRLDPKPILVTVKEFGLVGLEAAGSGTGAEAPALRGFFDFGSSKIEAEVSSVDPASGTYNVSLPKNVIKTLPALGSLTVEPFAKISGYEILFSTSTRQIRIVLGNGMPNIVSSTASDIDKDGVSKISVVIDGPKEGSGSAKILNTVSMTRSPLSDLSSALSIIGSENLVNVAQGSRASVDVEVDPNFAANGALEFVIQVELTSRDGKSEIVPVSFAITMSKPFDLIDFLERFLKMIGIFLVLQSVIIAVAALLLTRLRSLPSTTKFVRGTIEIDADGLVSINGGSVASFVATWVNVDSSIKSASEYQIGGMTFKLFRWDAVKSLIIPERLEVHAKSSPGSINEIAIGNYTYNKRRSEVWALVRSSIGGSWVTTFNRGDVIRAVRDESPLVGSFICVLPDHDERIFGFELEASLNSAPIRASASSAALKVNSGSMGSEVAPPAGPKGPESGESLVKTEFD